MPAGSFGFPTGTFAFIADGLLREWVGADVECMHTVFERFKGRADVLRSLDFR